MALPSNIANPSHISELISNLIINRNRIRDKLYKPENWDMTEAAGETLEGLANIIENISTHKNIDVDLREGDSYNIPKGYHDGSGVVTGVAGGGNYTLQAKTVSAGRSDITVVPDQGKYGLSSVKVNAIPSNLQDVSLVTAAAGDVLVGKTIVSSTGAIVAGTMVNNGAVSQTLSTSVTQYTVPAGYHNGSGKVSVNLEEKSITPAATSQTVVPTTGSLLSKVTVNAIPAPYYDVSGVDAVASNVFTGKKFVNSSGVLTTGTMTNRGAVSQTLSTTTTQYTVTQGYHNGSGTVKIVLEDKAITPAAAAQTVYPTAGKVFNKITVNAIPAPYYNTSGVTAVASHVLTGDKFVNSSGATVTGTMADNSAVGVTLDILNTSYTVPTGFHNGNGLVGIVTETQTTTPSTASQTITATNGKVLASVTVNAIPSQYKDTTGADAVASQVLTGKKFVNTTGTVTGTMPNNGSTNASIYFSVPSGASGYTKAFTIPSGYHDGTGVVQAQYQIKTVTPTTSNQTIRADQQADGQVPFLSSVIVNAIPSPYYDVSGVTAAASQVLAGTSYVTSSGVLTSGTMVDRGAVTQTLNSLRWSYTIPTGYHNGSGRVYIMTESKSVTPASAIQTVTPTDGSVLSAVYVGAIPEYYADARGCTATAENLLTGTTAVMYNSQWSPTAKKVTGTMANNGAVNQTLTTASTQYTVPTGYHNGSGTVKIVLETKSVTPTTSAQTITPTTGKVLSSVSVAAIPTQYKDTTGADAVAANVLSGKKFVNTTGTVTGTMANNGSYVSSVDGLTIASKLIPQGYHDGTGYIYLTNDIEIALESI